MVFPHFIVIKLCSLSSGFLQCGLPRVFGQCCKQPPEYPGRKSSTVDAFQFVDHLRVCIGVEANRQQHRTYDAVGSYPFSIPHASWKIAHCMAHSCLHTFHGFRASILKIRAREQRHSRNCSTILREGDSGFLHSSSEEELTGFVLRVDLKREPDLLMCLVQIFVQSAEFSVNCIDMLCRRTHGSRIIQNRARSSRIIQNHPESSGMNS